SPSTPAMAGVQTIPELTLARPSEPSAEQGSATAARPAPRDLLQTQVPARLEQTWRQLQNGTESSLGPVYLYLEEQPNDPRPWLLLGHSFVHRGWRSDAIEHYRHAYSLDPSCRGDARMLSNLVEMATHRLVHQKAAEAIREIYGQEA